MDKIIIKNKTGNGFHMRLKQFLLNEHYKGNEVIIEDSKGEYKQFIKLLDLNKDEVCIMEE